MADIISKKSRIESYTRILSSLPLPKKIGLPSDFAEKNIYLTRDVSPITGKYSYNPTPHWREVADCAHPSHPAKIIFVIKGGQSGATQGVVVPVTTWTVAENPCNMMVTSGNEVLSKEFVNTRFDPAVKSAGIMHLLKPNVIRAKNGRSGNTDSHKQYAGGNAFFCSIGAVDTVGKQKSLTVGLFDDFSASKLSDARQGNLFNILQTRFNTSAMTQKQFYISTCELSPDPTYLGFLKGDQRKWHVPCPCCEEPIELKFSVDVSGIQCGLIYDKDDEGFLVEGSVRYKCQNCMGEFEEREKYRIMNKGNWIPTAKPVRPDWYSYHISALYGAASFDGWDVLVREWIDVFADGEADTDKLKAFKNLRLGEQYEDRRKEVSANKLLSNSGDYEVGVVPDVSALNSGCGRIVLITCGVDCGGTDDDARLDYEIVAWAENGQSFSIAAGEIGTHSNNKKIKNDETRVKWTYRWNYNNCVWNELEDIVNKQYPCESGDGYGVVELTAIDIGYSPKEDAGDKDGYVSTFINEQRITAVAVKGNGDKLVVPGADRPVYKKSAKINGLFIIDTNNSKELVSKDMNKSWDVDKGTQPFGYMNFPTLGSTGYGTTNFFDQLTGEESVPVVGSSGIIRGYRWQLKKGSQNHKFDCKNYNYVAKQIHIDDFFDKPRSRFSDYCNSVFAE